MIERVTASNPTSNTASRLRHSVHRLALAMVVAVALLVLYSIKPTSNPVALPKALRPLAESVIGSIDVTTMLVAATAMTIVAMVRRLPYGAGAVLTLCVGANLTSAGIRTWVTGEASWTLLPSGHLVAVAAVVGSALFVAAPRFVPAVSGLGFVMIVATAGAAIMVEPTSPAGVAASLAIVAVWWLVASTVMLYSPVAKEREELRPDTAAIAFSRRRY